MKRIATLILLTTVGCSAPSNEANFLPSGTVTFSAAVKGEQQLAPVVGFVGAELNRDGFLRSGTLSKTGKVGSANRLAPVAAFKEPAQSFLPSGTVTVSGSLKQVEQLRLAPIVGFNTPLAQIEPSPNETWLEVDRDSLTVTMYRGNSKIKEMKAEGTVTLSPGTYNLEHKQRRPLWYAPDDYFTKRFLTVPPANDRLRYRKGALGSYVLYPTTNFPIHSGPVWSQDVGGLRVSRLDLSSVYYMLPVGNTRVVVK